MQFDDRLPYLGFICLRWLPAHNVPSLHHPGKTTKVGYAIKQFIERFSFECRKVIGFALSTRCDWFKRFAPPFHPIRSKTKANIVTRSHAFSRAFR